MFTAQNLRNLRSLYNLTQEELALTLGVTRELVNKMESGKRPISKSTSVLLQKFVQERQSEQFSQEVDFLGTASVNNSDVSALHTPYYIQRREQKNEKLNIMVPLVGIKAQAGYVKGYEQVDQYLETLEKYSLLPGVQPGGANWSFFEVDGDSMEPTFSAGDVILTSMVHMEDWQDIKNFGVYVILTADSLVVKRVYRKSDSEWVLISDNEEIYPQKLLLVSQIKEVWTFRRHISAKAVPVRDYQIVV